MTFRDVPEITSERTVRLRAAATDRTGVDHVMLYVNDVLVSTPTIQPSGEIEATAELAEGPNTIRLTAFDTAGNEGSYQVVVVVDTQPPLLFARDLGAPGYVSEATFLLEGTASDLNGITSISAVIGDRTYPIDPIDEGFALHVPLSEGLNEIRVTAADRAGNVSVRTIQVILDTVPPELDVAWPVFDAAISSTALFADVRVVDASPVEVWLDGVPCDAAGSGSFSCSLLLGGEGAHLLTFGARDLAGNISGASVPVLVGLTAPVFELSLFGGLEPLPSSGLALGPQAGDLLALTLRVDSLSATTGDFAGMPFSAGRGGATIPLTIGLSEGECVFDLSASNEAGLLSNGRWSVIYDTTPPFGTVDLPEVGRGVVSFTIHVEDALTGVSSVSLRMDGMALPPAVRGDDGSFVLNVDTAAWADGPHLLEADGPFVVEIRATDRAGNSSTVQGEYVSANFRPQRFLISPAAGAVLRGESMRIVVDVDDPHFESVSCTVDGASMGAGSADPRFETQVHLFALSMA